MQQSCTGVLSFFFFFSFLAGGRKMMKCHSYISSTPLASGVNSSLLKGNRLSWCFHGLPLGEERGWEDQELMAQVSDSPHPVHQIFLWAFWMAHLYSQLLCLKNRVFSLFILLRKHTKFHNLLASSFSLDNSYSLILLNSGDWQVLMMREFCSWGIDPSTPLRCSFSDEKMEPQWGWVSSSEQQD